MRLLALFILLATTAFAQPDWTPVSAHTDIRTLTVLDDGTILAGTPTDGLRSVDGGVTFDTLRFVRQSGTGADPSNSAARPDGINAFSVLAATDAEPAVVFAAGEDGGYQSADGGRTWQFGPPGFVYSDCPDSWVEYRGVSVGSTGIVAFTGEGEDGPAATCKDKTVSYVSTDRGDTWVSVFIGRWSVLGFGDSGLISFRTIVATLDLLSGTQLWSTDLGPGQTVSFTSDKDEALYAAVRGVYDFNLDPGTGLSSGVWRSDNDGETWAQFNTGLPTLDIRAVLALDNGRVLAGTHANGVYVSTDRGESWQPASGGLSGDALTVGALAVGSDGVLVSTLGGVFRSSAFAVTDEEDPEVESTTLAAWPNPVASRATVELQMPATATARVEAFDALGRRMAVLHDGPVSGALRLSVDVSRWPTGVYVVRASSAEGSTITRLTVAR